jgi:hypothetical protein
VAYAWPENTPRYYKIAKFVREFFGKIDQFRDGARHPKWNEVNVAAEMPGWTRFKPAADWLAEQRVAAAAAAAAARARGAQALPEGGAELKLAFDQFVDQYAATRGLKSISASDQEMLLFKFRQYLQSQLAARAR